MKTPALFLPNTLGSAIGFAAAQAIILDDKRSFERERAGDTLRLKRGILDFTAPAR